MKEVKVLKKDGMVEVFNEEKIHAAIQKSAERVMVTLSKEDMEIVSNRVKRMCEEHSSVYINVTEIHKMVEVSLAIVSKEVAESYRSYRNYKTDFSASMDEIWRNTQQIMYRGDKENANVDSTLISTKRSLMAGELSKELYKKFFLTPEENQIIKDGYIYIHDMKDRIMGSINCCLFDVGTVLDKGFELGNIHYTEPKLLSTACSVLGDIILSASAMQYGGFSTCEIDKVLGKYVEKSYDYYYKKQKERFSDGGLEVSERKLHEYAKEDTFHELRQGIQGLEVKLNTISSSRGDFPFTTFSFGLGESEFEQMVTETLLKVRMKGQGEKGKEIPVLFPKLTMFYHEDLHGNGKPLEHLFDLAIKCSSEANYPDYISLSGDDYVSEMYQKYKLPITPMGCRAWLSPYYEKGGMYQADETDKPYFVGRFNIGAISLNLPMIYQKSKVEDKPFYETLDHYLVIIRNLHIRTYDYIGNMTASTNPLGFCEGGFVGGNLKPEEKIKPLMKSATASFGVTALNELCQLHYQKSIHDDPTFAIEVMEYINEKVEQFKKEDNNLYAIYGVPAESLCGKQVQQFRKKFGIIKNVSDREYFTNSFHSHVTENITPFEKQDDEKLFWDLFNGGKIQYTRYKVKYNHEAIKAVVKRGMSMGFYQGVNIAQSFCGDCGERASDVYICPSCGSENITKIDRTCGYLGYSRVKGETRFNEAKQCEIDDRVSM